MSHLVNTSNRFFTMSRLLVLYWLLFWLMNGLDKFLHRSDVGIFTWHGKDRSNQFGGYFTNSGLSAEWINTLLYCTGIWELVIVVPLVITSLASLTLLLEIEQNY